MDTSFKIAYCSVASLSSMVFSLHGKKIYSNKLSLIKVICHRRENPGPAQHHNECRKKESCSSLQKLHDSIHYLYCGFWAIFLWKGWCLTLHPSAILTSHFLISPTSLVCEQNYFSFTMFVKQKVFIASKILLSTLDGVWTSVNTAVLNTSSPLRIFALSHDR